MASLPIAASVVGSLLKGETSKELEKARLDILNAATSQSYLFRVKLCGKDDGLARRAVWGYLGSMHRNLHDVPIEHRSEHFSSIVDDGCEIAGIRLFEQATQDALKTNPSNPWLKMAKKALELLEVVVGFGKGPIAIGLKAIFAVGHLTQGAPVAKCSDIMMNYSSPTS